MIPAGLESKKSYKYIDDSDEDYEDEEFDFSLNINKNNDQYLNENTDNNFKSSVELNNNYYYDENKFILDDLKNALLNKNVNLAVEILDKHSLDVNLQFDTNWIPIMYAVQSCSFDLTKLLIDRGADITFTDEDSFSVLMCACGAIDSSSHQNNLLNIVELILSKCSDPEIDANSCDKYYQTPLMYACRAGNDFLIDLLVKYGASLNSVDDNNWTSLSHACSKGHINCVKKLLQLKADAMIPTSDYYFSHDLAEKNGHLLVSNLVKRFLKLKKFENTNDLNELFDEIQEKFDTDLDEPSYYLNKKGKDELEIFLDNLNLSKLANLFKKNKINIKILLNLNDQDLINIGINEFSVRELILKECRIFHQKCWKSSTLIPIRSESRLNCNEIIAIINNISKYLDFMQTNIKFIRDEVIGADQEIFGDNCLNTKLYNELKQTLLNCDQLKYSINDLITVADNNIVDQYLQPVDLIKPKHKIKPLKNNKFAFTASIIGLSISAVYFLFKFKK